MKIPFYKCNGNGNTFIIVSHNNSIHENKISKNVIKNFCFNLEKKIIDGFILLNKKNKNIIMNYFNNDGSWETFCLNGLCCAGLVYNQESGNTNFEIVCNKISYKIKSFLIINFINIYFYYYII